MKRTALLLLAFVCAPALARGDGMLDPGFGNGGRVTTNFGFFAMDEARALVVLPDGRAVAAGVTAPTLAGFQMAAARYLPSGALDTTFDGDGLVSVLFPLTPDTSVTVEEALLQADGKLVLVGAVSSGPPSPQYALARLDANGSLDATFGTGGRVMTPLPGVLTVGVAAALQPDGRIVVLGATGSVSAPVIALVRYNTNGSLDPSFGTGGMVSVPLGGVPLIPRAVALQPDGKILVGGTVGVTGSGPFDFGVIRLLPGGALDPTFDGDGLATTDFGAIENTFSMAVQNDGRIVLAGYRGAAVTDIALVRYLGNGSLDTAFGTGGLATADSGASEIATAVIVQPNGKLLVAGWTNDPGSLDFILARFNPDGTHDTSFGTSGFLRTDFASGWDEAHALVLAGPDRVLVAGLTQVGDRDFALARYIATTPVEAVGFSVE